MKLMEVLSFLDNAACPYTTDTDGGKSILTIIGIAKAVVRVLQIAVPIALIIWGTIDIGKAVIAGDEKKIKEAQKPFVKRVIAAIIVFCIPFIVELVLGYVSNGQWKSCWDDAVAGVPSGSTDSPVKKANDSIYKTGN